MTDKERTEKARTRIVEARDRLSTAGANLRCDDVVSLLSSLGFVVKGSRRKPGHKNVTHPGVASFTTASFNCGHGKNPEIKRPYIKNMIKVLTDYEAELIAYLR